MKKQRQANRPALPTRDQQRMARGEKGVVWRRGSLPVESRYTRGGVGCKDSVYPELGSTGDDTAGGRRGRVWFGEEDCLVGESE